MLEGDKIKVAQGENPCYLLLNQANRHGLIAGASGTGKTVTMKVLAEGFAQAGVPVFMADVKGDVTGMAQPGDDTEKVRERAAALGAAGWEPRGCDVRLWDMLGGDGVPVRITISDMGPDLLARLLGLTDVQRGVLAIAFRMADDNGMLLIDLKDLRAMLGYLSEHASEVETLYGRVSSQSVGAIQRALLTLEDAGGDIFFGEPALDITDWLVTDDAGQGTVNILNAAKLMASPQVYAMFLLWMLSEIYGVTNWDYDFKGHKLQGDFQAALGVTIRVPHLSWMTMKGEAKRDYPASIFYQSPWYKEYPMIENHYARLNTAMTRGQCSVRVGVIHPIESFWLLWGPKQQTAAQREQAQGIGGTSPSALKNFGAETDGKFLDMDAAVAGGKKMPQFMYQNDRPKHEQ